MPAVLFFHLNPYRDLSSRAEGIRLRRGVFITAVNLLKVHTHSDQPDDKVHHPELACQIQIEAVGGGG